VSRSPTATPTATPPRARRRHLHVTVTAAGNITLGQPIYITSATYALTDAAGAGKQLFGHALSTSTGAGAKSIDVKIAHFAVAVDTPA
jgi:hypothetical protein